MPRKLKKFLFLFLPLFFIVAANIYFRSFTINFPQLKTRAKDIIDQSIKRSAAGEVFRKFPQFNILAKEKVIESRTGEYKRASRKQIEEQANEGWRKMKERFQDEEGQTYLMELDCWHWARYVENVLKYGHCGDGVWGDRQVDLLMLAPLGSPMHWEHLLYYSSAYLYKVFSIFKSVPLFTFLFYLPLLFAAVFLTLFYLFAYRLGGHITAIVSSLVMGMSPIFLQRSCAGWFDKDILSLIFPLLVIWAYASSTIAPDFRKKMLRVFVSSLAVGLFCYTWTHWWFIFVIVVIYEIIQLVFLIISGFYFKKQIESALKEHAFSLSAFIICSFFWILVFCRQAPLVALFKQLIQALTLNKPLMASIWPNVYATVGELRSLGIKEIANSAGGMHIFWPSLLSLLAALVISLVNRDYPVKKRNTILFLVIWTVVMLFAASRGIRFVLFLPFSLGISLGLISSEIFRHFAHRKNPWAIVIVISVLLIFCGSIVRHTKDVAGTIYPLMNDTWYKVLNLIKEKTPEGTIINSWWDFGDWFKAVAGRPVIFDGQSQDSPQAYWMAKALLTSDEDEAIGILRMLNNSGNKAFETINEHLKDPLESVLLLERAIKLPAYQAEEALKHFLPEDLSKKVMGLIWGRPGRACFIVENTMIPKMGAISYLGTWDFSKVYIAQNFDKKERSQIIEHLKGLGRNTEEIQRFYQEAFLIKPKNLDDWLSGRVLFYGEPVNGRQQKDGGIVFENGFSYDPEKETIRSAQGQIPVSLFVLQGNNFVELKYGQPNVGFSVLVVKDEDKYKCILLDRQLANSMFVRLYFFRGAGLRHFTPLIEALEENNFIRVFNIIW